MAQNISLLIFGVSADVRRKTPRHYYGFAYIRTLKGFGVSADMHSYSAAWIVLKTTNMSTMHRPSSTGVSDTVRRYSKFGWKITPRSGVIISSKQLLPFDNTSNVELPRPLLENRELSNLNENWLTNKDFMPKIILNRDFALAREVTHDHKL